VIKGKGKVIFFWGVTFFLKGRWGGGTIFQSIRDHSDLQEGGKDGLSRLRNS